MSNRRNYSPESAAAIDRFFTAFQTLLESGKVKGITAWCRDCGVDKSNFIAQRRDRGRGYFQTSWMSNLVTQHGVSPRWLLTGVGQMFDD